MPSAYDLYTFYLSSDHLRGRSVQVAIEAVEVEQVFNPRTKRPENRLVVRFHGKKLALCCNKTQVASLIDITGTDDYSRWPGHLVTLTPSAVDRGRATITITPASRPTEPIATVEPEAA